MKSFLQEVINQLLKEYQNFQHTVLVVPGMRPKAFIKKTFIEHNFTGILPEIITIEELLERITSLKSISGIPLWFAAYYAYSTTENYKSFDDFLKFAPTLLKDFDDIDASLTNHENLMDLLISEEKIKKWGKDMDIGLSEMMSNHIGFWTDARTTFYTLRQNLLNEGKAYRGLLAKKASEQVHQFLDNTKEDFVFVGFNALTQAELNILFEMTLAKRAESLWDADTYYLNQPNQEAGDFLRKYKKKLGEKFRFVSSNFVKEKDLKIYDVPKHESQAKLIGDILQEYDQKKLQKTAIVLGDEKLLPAVLNSLPPNIQKINITMGLPLNAVPMAGFFKELIQLHMNREKFGNERAYYFQNIINLLTDNGFGNVFDPESSDIIQTIRQQNIIFVSEKKLTDPSSRVFDIFKIPESINQFPKQVVAWINDVQQKIDISDYQSEYLFRFRSIFQQLANYIHDFPWIESYKTLNVMFTQLLQSESISFVGEPLVGLQLLGMLETRLLDFEHIILSSVNEGTLPLGRQENTLIPFDFRKEAGLNTFLENDAIYAYHFYRLIQRCSSANFIYNSDTQGMGSGEMSRFLLQIMMESPHDVQRITASPIFKEREIREINIAKTPFVQEKLAEWQKGISPSAIGSYLWDEINFYQQYILRIREEDDVEEIAGNLTLGNIIHDTLEQLYTPFLNTILTPDIFKKINQNKKEIFDNVANQALLKGNERKGKNILILNVAEEMINNVLRKDESTCTAHELIIKELEPNFSADYVTPNGNAITFKGKIDRIDSLDGFTRILDYKTGSVYANKLQINADKEITNDQDKAMQLAIYAYMYFNKYPEKREVTSGIYPLRYFNEDIIPLQWDKNPIISHDKLQEIIATAGNVVDEILNPDIPFTPKED